MIDLTTFEPARDALEADGYAVSIGEMELAPKVPALFVDLRGEEGAATAEWFLQLMIVQDLARAVEDPLGEPDLDDPEITMLQFTMVVPTLIKPEVFVECMRAAFLINTLVPVGGIGIIEAQQRFYFDYKLALADRSVDDLVLSETVAMMAFCAETYGPLLMELAAGRMSVETLLKLLQGEANEVH